MTHRTTISLLGAALLSACSSTPAPQSAAAEGNEDYVTALLEAATRAPAPTERVSERLPARARSRGLADADLPPVVLELATHQEGEDGEVLTPYAARVTLVRFPDLVHLTSPDGGDVWVFHRNPLATDEVSGQRVDHASRFVIDYTDSELALENVLDGWARLAQGFVSPEDLDGLRATGATTEFEGHTFERLASDDLPTGGAVLKVDWCAELGLPRRVVWATPDGVRVQELIALRPATEADRPEAFPTRWPDYERMDLSDWREEIHDHAGGTESHAGHGHASH